MAFNIGQLRRNDIQSYTTPINYNFSDLRTSAVISDAIIFIDKKISTNGGNTFESNKSYYLSFSVNRTMNSEQIIKVYLRNPNQIEDNTQLLQTYSVINGDPAYSESFELIFTPNSTYSEIIFELQRTAEDYMQLNADGTSGRKMTMKIFNLSTVVNILSNLESNILKKIGIQGPPGLMMCINGEEIHIGRSGIYELNLDIDITYLGFIIKQSSQTMDGLDYFVMDYQY